MNLLVDGLGPEMVGCGATVVLGQVFTHWGLMLKPRVSRAQSWVSGCKALWVLELVLACW